MSNTPRFFPLPGSDAATDQGCICPAVDFDRDFGLFGERGLWRLTLSDRLKELITCLPVSGKVLLTDGCPLHCPKEIEKGDRVA